MWLDNYNERGCFDDRTLVVIKTQGSFSTSICSGNSFVSLDNCNERGSFDDRTLVVIKKNDD